MSKVGELVWTWLGATRGPQWKIWSALSQVGVLIRVQKQSPRDARS